MDYPWSIRISPTGNSKNGPPSSDNQNSIHSYSGTPDLLFNDGNLFLRKSRHDLTTRNNSSNIYLFRMDWRNNGQTMGYRNRHRKLSWQRNQDQQF